MSTSTQLSAKQTETIVSALRGEINVYNNKENRFAVNDGSFVRPLFGMFRHSRPLFDFMSCSNVVNRLMEMFERTVLIHVPDGYVDYESQEGNASVGMDDPAYITIEHRFVSELFFTIKMLNNYLGDMEADYNKIVALTQPKA